MQENTDLPNSIKDDGYVSRRKPRSALEPIQMFDEAGLVSLEVEILEENYRELKALMQANEWGTDEGLRTVFLAGLGFQRAQWHLDAISALAQRDDPALIERVDAMVNELASYHSMYSVLKFKAFKLYKLNQVLEFNNSGLRAQEELWQEWAARMRRDKEDLKAEVIRLRALLSEFKLDWDSGGGPPLPPGIEAALYSPPYVDPAPAVDEQISAVRAAAEDSSERVGLWKRLMRLFKSGE